MLPISRASGLAARSQHGTIQGFLRRMFAMRWWLVNLVALSLAAQAFAAPPTDPSLARILPDHGATKKAQVIWKDNSSTETAFEVERKEAGGAFAKVHTTATDDVITWTDSGLDAAKVYTYRARAITTTEQSGYTNETSVNFTVAWPVATAEADIELLHGYGDGLGLTMEKMHIGVDIQEGGKDSLAGRSGLVFSNVGSGANQGMWLWYKIDGVDWYWHSNHLSSIDAAATVTEATASTYKTVIAGQKVGVITDSHWTAPWNHTHISHTTGGFAEANNRNPLTMYSADGKKDPKKIKPKANIDYDGDGDTLLFKKPDNTYLAYNAATTPVNGNIDLSVEVHNEQGTSPRQGVDVIKYWIEATSCEKDGKHDVKSAAKAYTLANFSANWMLDSNWDTIYDSGKNQKTSIPGSYPWNNYHHYLVTNTTGEDGTVATLNAAQYWNTNAKDDASAATVAHANFAGLPDATKAEEARFPDGKYTIHVLMSDLLHSDEEHKFEGIVVDNFPAAVKKISAKGLSMVIEFSEPMDQTSAEDSFFWDEIEGDPISYSTSWDENGCVATLMPDEPPTPGFHLVHVDAGTAKDLFGKFLDGEFGTEPHNGTAEGSAIDSVTNIIDWPYEVPSGSAGSRIGIGLLIAVVSAHALSRKKNA